MKKIAVCIATYNRNEQLEKCLDSVLISASNVTNYEILLVVVDNSESPRADKICNKYKNKMKIIFYWEKRPGIPFARNKCLKGALENNVDFIAFIDDDEKVDPEWLPSALFEIDNENIDIVSGQVIREYNDKTVSQVNLPDKSKRDRAETGNVIMKAWIATKLSFDEDMALIGGTDVLFFRQATELGAIIIFCEEVIVRECMPEQRHRFSWRLQRHYRYGLAHCIIESRLKNGSTPLKLLAKASLMIPLGFGEFLLRFPFSGIGGALLGIDRVMRSIGTIAYFLGFKYEEYKR